MRSVNTESRRARAREEMLRVAAEIFREKGFDRSRMEDVARELGMLKGSLYYYFESKQEILDEILLVPRERFLRRLEEIASSRGTPSVKLRKAIKAFISGFDVEYPAMSVAVYERFSRSGHQAEEVRRLRRRVQEIFERLVQDGVDAGEFETKDVKMTTFAIAGMCNWLSTWYEKGGRLSSQRIGDVFADLVLHGLERRPASDAPRRARPEASGRHRADEHRRTKAP